MKKIIIAVAAIAILSAPAMAKPSNNMKMMHEMMMMIKKQKAMNAQFDRILQNMMDNLSSSHHG